MLVRDYNAKDKQQCIRMFVSNMPRFFAPHELTDFDAWLDRRVYPAPAHDQYFVLEKDNAIIGCGGYYYDPQRNMVRFTWGLISNEFHRIGYGRFFIQYRMRHAASAFPNAIQAMDTTQHSWPFFEKMGFECVSIEKDGYCEGMDRYELILPAAKKPSEH